MTYSDTAPGVPQQNLPPSLFGRRWELTLAKPVGGPTANVSAPDLPPQIVPATEVGGPLNPSATQGGTQLPLGAFHFTFEVDQIALQTPWRATVTIYNPPSNYSPKVYKEYSKLTISAGYANANTAAVAAQQNQTPGLLTQFSTPAYTPGSVSSEQAAAATQQAQQTANQQQIASGVNPGQQPGRGFVLFVGDVVWFERGRENATDTYIKLFAMCFDNLLNTTIVNQTLPAGHNDADVVQACVNAMNSQAPFNADPSNRISIGALPDEIQSSRQSIRARTVFGQTPDVLRDCAQSHNGYAYIDFDNSLIFITQQSGPIARPVIELNSKTGMVGVPHQNMDGSTTLLSLLNANLRPGAIIKVNEKDIVRTMLTNAAQSGQAQTIPAEQQAVQWQMEGINSDDTYTVWSAVHTGDTRGDAWYTEITTRAVNITAQPPAVG
jgi:hypothetical protein